MEFDRVGKYQILNEIGRGTMGRVFKAQDPVLGRFVAVKTLSYSLGASEESRKRFHREAQAAAVISHPNIVTVHDFGEEKGLIYMAMELLEGKDLRDALADGDLPTLQDKLRIMDQVMAGLAFAHSKGVIHRDLKPANIHIQPNGQVKIVDFGLARLSTSEMTQDGIVLGTPNYMSPEQALGDKIDARSDVFAAGAVFYEALTGFKPFDAESTPGVLFQVVHKQQRPVRDLAPEVPQVLADVVEKALIKDKTKRFQSARQMRAALAVARQAVDAGRGPNATLAGESQRALREALQNEPPKREPDAASPPPLVHGSAALDVGLAPAARAKLPGTWSGRSSTQVASRSAARVPPARSSRLGLVLGGGLGLVVIAGLALSYVAWSRSRPAPPPAVLPSPSADPARAQVGALTQALVETQLKLAARELDDKNYTMAIEQADRVLKLDGQNAQARRIRGQASAKKEEVEAAANEAQQAADAGDSERASLALSRLLELDPRHPVAAALSEKLNSAFKTRAEEAGRSMARSRSDAEAAKARGSDAFARAEAAASDAEARLQKGDYAEATRRLLEARDGFDRARRAARSSRPAGPEPRAAPPSAAATETAAPEPSAEPAATAEPAGPARAFLTGKTTIASAREAGDIQGFDTADVKTRRMPELAGHLEFEAQPATVRPGDTLVVRLFLANEGKKPVRVRGVALTMSVNGNRSSLPANALARDVAPLQRTAVAEAKVAWPEGANEWSLDAVVTSDRDETAQSRLTWR